MDKIEDNNFGFNEFDLKLNNHIYLISRKFEDEVVITREILRQQGILWNSFSIQWNLVELSGIQLNSVEFCGNQWNSM